MGTTTPNRGENEGFIVDNGSGNFSLFMNADGDAGPSDPPAAFEYLAATINVTAGTFQADDVLVGTGP